MKLRMVIIVIKDRSVLRYKFYDISDVIDVLNDELSLSKYNKIKLVTYNLRVGEILELIKPTGFEHRLILKYPKLKEGQLIKIQLPQSKYTFNLINVDIIENKNNTFIFGFSKFTFNPDLFPSILVVKNKKGEIRFQIQTVMKRNNNIDVQYYYV